VSGSEGRRARLSSIRPRPFPDARDSGDGTQTWVQRGFEDPAAATDSVEDSDTPDGSARLHDSGSLREEDDPLAQPTRISFLLTNSSAP